MLRQSLKTSLDDITESVPNKHEALRKTGEIRDILNSGSFKIKKWTITRNEKAGHDLIKNQEDIKSLTQILVDNTVTESEFGMKCNFQKDIFIFDKRSQHTQFYGNKTKSISKQEILAIVNGIYDSLGLISPFTVRAKILMRKLWLIKQLIGTTQFPKSSRKSGKFSSKKCI